MTRRSERTRAPKFTGARGWVTYRGGIGMAMWALHRLAGLGILFFLVFHIIDIFLLAFGEEVFNELLFFYRAPWALFLEVFLLFGVLFHALNGLRIIIQDFYPDAMLAQMKLVTIELVVLAIIFLPAAFLMLRPLFE